MPSSLALHRSLFLDRVLYPHTGGPQQHCQMGLAPFQKFDGIDREQTHRLYFLDNKCP